MNIRRVLIVACALSLVAAAVSAGAGGGAGIRVAAVSDRVLVSIPGHRTTEFTAATDPVDPLHLVAAGIDWDTGHGTWTCGAYVSRDGGRTWNGTLVAPLPDFDAQGDPWVAIDGNGVAHVVCLDLEIRDQGGASMIYARSADGGSTWSEPVALAPRGPSHSVDRTGVVAGRSGVVVACVNEYDFPHDNPTAPAFFDGLAAARSSDGGLTWTATQQITTTYAACRGAAAAPDGSLYLSFAASTETGTQTGVVRSTDDGLTWSSPTLLPNLEGDDPGGLYYGGAIAVSPTDGTVFVARPAASGPRLFRSSAHGFDHVALPAIPTSCASCTNVIRTLVTANASGDIGVQVEIGDLDHVRAQVPYPVSLTKEVWLLVSKDNGSTWLAPVKVAHMDPTTSYIDPRTFAPMPTSVAGAAAGVAANPTDAQANFWAAAGPMQRADHLVNGGDYTGMTTSGDTFVSMWIAHYNGIPQVWSARIDLA